MDVHEHPGAVDVADLQGQGFLQPQAERVDRPEKGPVVRRADRVQQAIFSALGENFRSFLRNSK